MIDVVLSENMFAMAAASSTTNALKKKPQSGSDSGLNLSGSKPKPTAGSATKPAAPKAPQG